MAAWAGSRVRQVAERVIQAEDGMTGRLGNFSWSVLNPSRTATEAEDSNDGSIAMLWRSPDINLLALADLGERGQQRLVAGHQALLAEAASAPLILKVAHHGSADCYQELYEELDATMALISVGVDNGYGHPTRRAMAALEFAGTRIYRTDQLGSIAIAARSGALEVSVAGGG
jgi:competence protein ComEC